MEHLLACYLLYIYMDIRTARGTDRPVVKYDLLLV